MYRKVPAFFIILVLLCTALHAEPSLLAESVLSATYEELAAMSRAYGLDGTLGENELRRNLLEFFGIRDDAAAGQAEQAGSASNGTSVDSIEIINADSLVNSGRVVILSGNVEMSFSAEGSSRRSFNADRVVVDLERRILEASGSVSLSDDDPDGRVFSGEVIRLDWDNLNVIVYDGISTTTRNNSDGKRILFYAKGDSVAYNGDTSGIFFRNGVIATTLDDPYWSIEAARLSLTENDMFVDRAVFRLGRVPVFYFPVFFYPGTTLAFNPAMGYSSEKGAFLNTTVEIYGSYPGLGVTGSKTDSDESDYSASISSFLNVEQEGEQIRDGWYYRTVEEGEDLGPLETWARSTGSYLAVFADTYEKLGLVLGFDTKNSFLDNRFTFTATGAAGYTPVRTDQRLHNFRYSFNLDASYRIENLRLSVKLPLS